ncbi:DUF6907 domain-containing protein [Streptomyces sp. NPDC001852]|uniref:DUF6907 domain-containing protein n=1 Tax=Streptomyces sp. NPDC001852 TaxID=3364619 RepID=UPI0036CB10E7
MSRTIVVDTLDAGPVEVEEPSWCLGHEGWPLGYRADITHNGPAVTAEVEAARGTVNFLEAHVTWAPFGELAREPYPLAYVEGLEPATVDAAELRMVAARLAVYADRLRDMARQLEDLKREATP